MNSAQKSGMGWPDDDLNELAGASVGPNETTREQFLEALRGAISTEAAAGARHQAGGQPDRGGNNDCLDRTGAFTEHFRDELRLIADEQLGRLEALESQAAAHDLFGVLRRRCEAC